MKLTETEMVWPRGQNFSLDLEVWSHLTSLGRLRCTNTSRCAAHPMKATIRRLVMKRLKPGIELTFRGRVVLA